MLHRSLDAFVREDVDLALGVCRSDDEIDKLHDQLFRELLAFMVEDPRSISRAMRLLFISKYLERIGDHATNIAEMVIFMVKGGVSYSQFVHRLKPPTKVQNQLI